MRSRPHDEAMAELYRSDPAFALQVINDILEDGDQAELLTVLRHMAQAFGGVQVVAEQADAATDVEHRQVGAGQFARHGGVDRIAAQLGLRVVVVPAAVAPAGETVEVGEGGRGSHAGVWRRGLPPRPARSSSRGSRQKKPSSSRACIQVSTLLSRK